MTCRTRGVAEARRRGVALGRAARLCVAAIFLFASRAGAGDAPHGLKARGYVNARYAYVGLSHAPDNLSGMQITGSLEASALSDRIVLKYRSHSWIDFEHTPKSVLESPFRNRHVLQSISIEADRLAGGFLDLKAGRFFPELRYGSSPAIDGGAFTARRWRFSLDGSAGRSVDLWNGSEQSRKLAATGQLTYRSDRVTASAGYQRSCAFGFRQSEVPAGISVTLAKSYWLEAYAGYDFDDRHIARAGVSASWRRDGASVSLSTTQWRSPFDQLYLLEKSRSVAYFGLTSKSVPSTYDDVRLSASYGWGNWSVRASGGSMSGVRTGWTASAYVMTPTFLRTRWEVGAQGMRTDFVEFHSYDLTVMTWLGRLGIQAQSQARAYRWRPEPAGERVIDDYTELSLDYPLVKHVSLSAAAGAFFRKLGDESFQPQAELRVIARL